MKKKSLNTFFDVIPKSKIPHSLIIYLFFDVIPKSKIAYLTQFNIIANNPT